jgi:hypothetical protein
LSYSLLKLPLRAQPADDRLRATSSSFVPVLRIHPAPPSGGPAARAAQAAPILPRRMPTRTASPPSMSHTDAGRGTALTVTASSSKFSDGVLFATPNVRDSATPLKVAEAADQLQ